MRMLLFTDTLADVNGVARFIRGLLTDAAALGRDLHVVTTQRSAEVDADRVHVVPARFTLPLPGYSLLRLACPRPLAMLRLAASLRPDVIHVSTPGPVGLCGRWIARRLGVPLIGTSHTDFPAYVRDLYGDEVVAAASGGLLRWFYQPFARVLARSEPSRRALVGAGEKPDRTAAIAPGVDSTLFHPSRRDPDIWPKLGAPGDRRSLRVLYVGRASREKNLGLLGALWPIVAAASAARGLDARLAIVGDGPMLPALRDRLGDAAWFAGFRFGDELAALYASADLFIFPSRTDTLGQTVLEAMASGLPMIVSDAGGPADLATRSGGGVVVRSALPEKWAAAAVNLLTDEPRRRAVGGAARAFVEPLTPARSCASFWELNARALEDFRAAAPSPSR